MIRINLYKKLTKISCAFIFVSLLFIWFVGFYNASFKTNEFQLVINYSLCIKEYLFETNETILLIGVMLIIILVVLETDSNIGSFDAFYISHFGRISYHTSKLLAFVVIILFYITYLYIGIMLIYLWRFQNTYYCNFIVRMYLNTLTYLIYIFFLGYNLILLIKNHFISLSIILLYWLSKILINTKIDKYLKLFLLRLNFNYEKFTFGFEISFVYVIINIGLLIMLNYLIVAKKDIKC